MSLNIGVFTLMSEVDCLPVATHIANFIADGDHSVALKEAISKEDLFETAKANFEENGTFVANSVRYYPNRYQGDIAEDTIITVFGEVGFLQEFNEDFAKLYLVCKGRIENKEIIDQFLIEMPQSVKNNIELILLGASKEELSTFLTEYRCTSISEYHSNVCPYNLSFRVASVFAEHGLPRPIYHKDWVYEEVTYHYVPEPEKRTLFSRFGVKKKQKKQEQVVEETTKETAKEPVPIVSEVQVHEKKVVSDANEFSDVWEVIDVPVPAPKPTSEPVVESVPEQILEPPTETQETKPESEKVQVEESVQESIPEVSDEPEITADPESEPIPEPETQKEEHTEKGQEEKTPKKVKPKKEKPKREKRKRTLFSHKESDEQSDNEKGIDSGAAPVTVPVPEPTKSTALKPHEREPVPEPKPECPVPVVMERPAGSDKKKPVLFGRRWKKESLHLDRLNVFVTGIDHSVGTSYVAGSLASAITDIYDKDVWFDHKGLCSVPDNYMVHEVMDEVDRFNAFKGGIIVQDKGIYDELSIMDRNEMMHADMNIMVSTAEEMDLRKIAQFIDIQGDLIRNWMFVFNHVLDHQRRTLEAAMRDYAYIIVPFHDNAEVPDELLAEWKDAIEYFTK